MDIQPCFGDVAWSAPSPSSFGLGELFLNHENADPALHGIVDFFPPTHHNNQSHDNKSLELHCFLTPKRGSSTLESDLGALAPLKKTRKMQAYRDIVPKQNDSSENIIAGIATNNVPRRGFKKGGRREPLKPEKSKKATKMRGVRACAACYISHVEVS
jgi:hypothetical protein